MLIAVKTRANSWLERLICVTTIGYVLMFYLYPDLHRPQKFFYSAVIPFTVIYGLLSIRDIPTRNKLLILNVVTITILSLPALWGSSENFDELWKLIKRGLYVGLFFIALWVLLKEFQSSLKKLIIGLLVVISISATTSLILYFAKYGVTIPRMRPALIPQPLFAAAAYGIGITLAAYLFCTEPNLKKASKYFFLALPLFLAVLLTQSRGPFLALAASIITYGLFPQINKTRWLALLTMLGMACLTIFFTTPLGELFLQRGTSYRTEIWSTVLSEMRGHALFGRGWSLEDNVITASGTFTHSHNVYLGTLRTSGIVGVTLLLILIFFHLLASFRSKLPEANLMGAWLMFGLVYMTTDLGYVITRPDIIWLVFWIPVIAISYFQGNIPRNKTSNLRLQETKLLSKETIK